MFKKEWLEIQVPAWSRIAVALFFLLSQLAFDRERSFAELALSLYIGFYICSLWAANYIGLSTFRAEFRDQAFEYLFSFPLSKGGLLLRKLLPRILLLAVILLFYLLLWKSAGLAADFDRLPFQSPLTYLSWFFFLFSAGFFLSPVDWGNLRSLVLPAVLIVFAILAGLFNKVFDLVDSQVSREIPAAATILIAGLGFFLVYWGRLNSLNQGIVGRSDFFSRSSFRLSSSKIKSYNISTYPFLVREMKSALKPILLIAFITWLLSLISCNLGAGSIDPGAIKTLLFGFMLLSYSFFSGLLVFSQEHTEGALEYLMTLPLNRWRLLGEKALGRLVFLLAALLAYLVPAGAYLQKVDQAENPIQFLFTPGESLTLLPIMLLLFFACGLFLSLFETKNTSALVSLAVFPPIILVPLALAKAIGPTVFIPLSGLVLVCLVLAVFFFRLYPRFDLASPQLQARSFNFSVLAVMSILSVSTFLYVI